MNKAFNFTNKFLVFICVAILLSACGGGGGGGAAVCSHLYCFSEAPVETSTYTLNGQSRTSTDQDPVVIRRRDIYTTGGTPVARYFELDNYDDAALVEVASDKFSRTSKSAISTHSGIDQEDGDREIEEKATSSNDVVIGTSKTKLRVYGYSKSSATPPTTFDQLESSYFARIMIVEPESASGTISRAGGRVDSFSSTGLDYINPFQVRGSIPTNIPTSGTFAYGGLIIEHDDLLRFRENHKMGSFSLELDFDDSTFEFKDVPGSTVRLVGSGELSGDGSFQASDLELLSNGRLESSAYGSIFGDAGSHVGGIWHTNEDSNYRFGAFLGDK